MEPPVPFLRLFFLETAMIRYQLKDFPIPVHRGKKKNFIRKAELQKWSEEFFANVDRITRIYDVGLCTTLDLCSNTNTGSNLITKYSKTWEHFSGNVQYPINITKESPYSEYSRYRHWKGKQLKARKDLMNHILKSMKKFEYLE